MNSDTTTTDHEPRRPETNPAHVVNQPDQTTADGQIRDEQRRNEHFLL